MKNVNFEDLKNALVEVFESEDLTAKYQEPSIMSECFGWAGVMSPVTRLAYVQEFGEDIVKVAENAARKQIAQKEEQRSRTQFAQHAKEADNLAGLPSEGSYFWCDNSGLKCDGGNGVFGEIEALVLYPNDKPTKRLCYAEQVFRVTEEEFNNKHLANELVEKHNLQGYCRSDDMEENDDFYNDIEKRATFYTVGALVVSPSGRWYLIDSEGYNYPRYIYVPMDWRTMYAESVKRVLKESFEDDFNSARNKHMSRGGLFGMELKNLEGEWEYGTVDYDPNTQQMSCMGVSIQVDPDMSIDKNLEALYEELMNNGYSAE